MAPNMSTPLEPVLLASDPTVALALALVVGVEATGVGWVEALAGNSTAVPGPAVPGPP